MKLCRFKNAEGEVRVGLAVDDATIADLSGSGVESITSLLEDTNGTQKIRELAEQDLPQVALCDLTLLTPVEGQEVWAAGVTYLRSKKARMEESDFSANAYDLVYDAARPEIFLKSLPSKVVGPGEAVGIREDSKWNVPEPELTRVVNSRKELVGYTIGNDMSSRDIEGENLLYLPQAKVYDRSCAVGPWLVMGANEAEVREWTIGVEILRDGKTVFNGETSINNIKRTFDELVDYLCRSQTFPQGTMLLTGTGVVPGDEFSLAPKDVIRITISGIGTLENFVESV